MNTLKENPDNPDAVVQEFQNRQKRLVITAFVCFLIMVPAAMKARTINSILAASVLLLFIVPLIGFYFWTFRCPACGTRVQQRRNMLRMPIYCGKCRVLLDPK